MANALASPARRPWHLRFSASIRKSAATIRSIVSRSVRCRGSLTSRSVERAEVVSQLPQKAQTVVVAEEKPPSAVAPRHEMIQGTRIFQPWRPCLSPFPRRATMRRPHSADVGGVCLKSEAEWRGTVEKGDRHRAADIFRGFGIYPDPEPVPFFHSDPVVTNSLRFACPTSATMRRTLSA